jgi:putative ABC transport system permease protein
LLLRKVMAGMLYGLSGNDPLILSIAPCVMLAITLLTSWLPARKSTRIDPITALRYE